MFVPNLNTRKNRMIKKLKSTLLLLFCVFNYAVAQEYSYLEVGSILAVPKSEIEYKGKPGFRMAYGRHYDSYDRVAFRMGLAMNFYKLNVTGYEFVETPNLFYSPTVKLVSTQVGLFNFNVSYEFLARVHIIPEKLDLIGGVELGLLPYAKSPKYDNYNDIYFTNGKVDSNRSYKRDSLPFVFARNPDFEPRYFNIGPKVGISLAPIEGLEINLNYYMSLNTFYSTDNYNLESAIGKVKYNFFQLSLIYIYEHPDNLMYNY